jgi:hypothetical protein
MITLQSRGIAGEKQQRVLRSRNTLEFMSGGHGKLERAIIDATDKEPGTLIPVLEIARDHGYDISKRATRQSWHRAAHCLEAQGEIAGRWVFPRSPDREVMTLRDHMLCVGTHVDRREVRKAAAERCGELINDDRGRPASQKSLTLSEAEFVMRMIERGRWKVADRRTGKPVDHHAAWLASIRGRPVERPARPQPSMTAAPLSWGTTAFTRQPG